MPKRRRRSRQLGAAAKKDFQAVADILCEHKASTKLVQAFATYFARQSPRFDVQRFATATRACRV